MASIEALRAFVERFNAELDPVVRRKASDVAMHMPKTAARNNWAAALALETDDVVILERLIDVVGSGLREYPKNAEVLRQLLHRTTERQLRRQLFAFIAPQAAGGAKGKRQITGGSRGRQFVR